MSATARKMLARIGMPIAGGAVAWLGAAALVAMRGGFGSSDLLAFAAWCMVLAMFVAGANAVGGAVFTAETTELRAIAAGLVGALLGLLFTAAVGMALGPWLFAFSFPVGLLWIVGSSAGLVGATLVEGPREGSLSRVALVTAFGLIAVFALPRILIQGSIHIWGKAAHEVYEVPNGFQGPVIVVYEVSDAPPLREVDGALQITVPASGIVLTSSPRNSGWKNPDVFYQSPGSRTPVATDWSRSNDSIQSVRAYWLGSRGRVVINGVPEPYLEYAAFAVAVRGSDDDTRALHDHLLDSLTLLYGR